MLTWVQVHCSVANTGRGELVRERGELVRGIGELVRGIYDQYSISYSSDRSLTMQD